MRRGTSFYFLRNSPSLLWQTANVSLSLPHTHTYTYIHTHMYVCHDHFTFPQDFHPSRDMVTMSPALGQLGRLTGNFSELKHRQGQRSSESSHFISQGTPRSTWGFNDQLQTYLLAAQVGFQTFPGSALTTPPCLLSHSWNYMALQQNLEALQGYSELSLQKFIVY